MPSNSHQISDKKTYNFNLLTLASARQTESNLAISNATGKRMSQRLAEKRRRMQSTTSSASSSSLCSFLKSCPTMKEMEEVEREAEAEQSISYDFESLPPEVLEMVFRMLPYKDIGQSVRLLSKKCSTVATTILNSALFSSRTRLRSTQNFLEAKAIASNNELDLSMYDRARNYLDYVASQLNLLHAVVTRYTHPIGGHHPKFGRLCFYGGAILDELDTLLRFAKKCPGLLMDKDGPATCIFQFTAMCKKFMNVFERISEKKINKSSLISGCKSIDILDCLVEGRELLHLCIATSRNGTRPGVVSMKLRYVMERSWFTCLDLPSSESQDDENSWRDQQRFMYLRLRRLVISVNEHMMEKAHYEKEMMMCDGKLVPIPKAPPCSTYSGYGEYAGKFFYYGNMNEYAFENKVLDTWRRGSLRERMRNKEPEDKPSYDLVIEVELRCSPELAPLSVRSMLKFDDFENPTHPSSRPEFYLRMNISCPASTYNKLPSEYVWEPNASRHLKST